MHNPQHPDTELLDRLRAGLLDDRHEEKAALEEHLANCESCRAQVGIWQQLGPDAFGPQLDSQAISDVLLNARQQALSARPRKQHRTLLPYAAAAVLVLAVSLGLWTSRPVIDTTNMVAENVQTVPDIYEDLDFYLWLADQSETGTDNGST